MEILKIKNTVKYGKKTVLDNIEFSVEAGKIIGLMGPNGSGKTTLLKSLSALFPVDEVYIDGKEITKNKRVEVKKIVSYMHDQNVLDVRYTAENCAAFYETYFADFDSEKFFSLCEKLEVQKKLPIMDMSKGMVEKLNLALCFARKARIYILDEPLGGIDPVARKNIISSIISLYSEDSSILISTHLVHDVENVFDQVCFIKDGKIILNGNTEDLRDEHNMFIEDLYVKTFGETNENLAEN